MATAAAPGTPAKTEIGTLGRLTGALFSPGATFADIARRPTWLVPIIVICVISVATTAIFGQRVGWRGFMEKQFENNKRVEQMPPDQREQALDRGVKFAPVIGYASSVIFPFVGALVVAAVLMALFNLAAGAELRFPTSLGIVSYAWMPGVVAGLIGIVVLFLRPPEAIDIQHLVASNPGALLPQDTSKVAMSLASSLDVFSFWTMILMAMGFSAANPRKLTTGKAFLFIFMLWVAYVLVKTGWVAAFA